MRTFHCCGHLSCHEFPLPHTPPSAMHTPLPCMSPLPCTPPAIYAPLPHTPPCQIHPLATYTPHHACPPITHIPPWTEFLTHACENITFPQLRLRTVITVCHSIAVTDNVILWNYEQSVILSNKIKQIAFELMYNRCHWEWVRLLRSPGFNEQIFLL